MSALVEQQQEVLQTVKNPPGCGEAGLHQSVDPVLMPLGPHVQTVGEQRSRIWLEELKEEILNVLPEIVNVRRGTVS